MDGSIWKGAGIGAGMGTGMGVDIWFICSYSILACISRIYLGIMGLDGSTWKGAGIGAGIGTGMGGGNMCKSWAKTVAPKRARQVKYFIRTVNSW